MTVSSMATSSCCTPSEPTFVMSQSTRQRRSSQQSDGASGGCSRRSVCSGARGISPAAGQLTTPLRIRPDRGGGPPRALV